jgi:hypothetical protein
MAVVFAAIVAIVALNSTKAVAPTAGAKAAPPPAVIDHGTSNGEMSRVMAAMRIDARDHGARDDVAAAAAAAARRTSGGWGGPRLGSATGDSVNAVKVTNYGGWLISETHRSRHPGLRPQ